MSVTNGKISNRIGVVIAADGVSGDLQKIFGVAVTRKQWYFTAAPINPCSKCKPFRSTTAFTDHYNSPSSARLAALVLANYGIILPSCTASELRTAECTYNRPTASHLLRTQDFEQYYHLAPGAIACCPMASTIVINAINLNGNPRIVFFVYQKSGMLADKSPDPVNGISSASAGRTSEYINAICDLSDLKVQGEHVTAYELTNPHLGLAIYDGTTFKGFFGCTSALVASQQVTDINMYGFPSTLITGLTGEYTAIACIRYGTTQFKYIPLQGFGGYSRAFSLKIGGAEYYTYTLRGLAETNVVSANNTLTTTDTGIAHQTSTATAGYWVLRTRITGTITRRGISNNIDRTQESTMANYYPGTGQSLTIAKDGYADITFALSKIWNNDASQPAAALDSGRLTLACSLVYKTGSGEQAFTRGASQPLLTVIYG